LRDERINCGDGDDGSLSLSLVSFNVELKNKIKKRGLNRDGTKKIK
jgi:hypothetical protein